MSYEYSLKQFYATGFIDEIEDSLRNSKFNSEIVIDILNKLKTCKVKIWPGAVGPDSPANMSSCDNEIYVPIDWRSIIGNEIVLFENITIDGVSLIEISKSILTDVVESNFIKFLIDSVEKNLATVWLKYKEFNYTLRIIERVENKDAWSSWGLVRDESGKFLFKATSILTGPSIEAHGLSGNEIEIWKLLYSTTLKRTREFIDKKNYEIGKDYKEDISI